VHQVGKKVYYYIRMRGQQYIKIYLLCIPLTSERCEALWHRYMFSKQHWTVSYSTQISGCGTNLYSLFLLQGCSVRQIIRKKRGSGFCVHNKWIRKP